MTVKELIEALKQYPEDLPVEIITPIGSWDVSNLSREYPSENEYGIDTVLIVSEEESNR